MCRLLEGRKRRETCLKGSGWYFCVTLLSSLTFWHFEEASSLLVWGKTLSFNHFLHYTVYHVWMGFLKDASAEWEMCITSNKVGVIRTNEALGFSLCVYLWFKGLLYDYLCGLRVLLHEASLSDQNGLLSLCIFSLQSFLFFVFGLFFQKIPKAISCNSQQRWYPAKVCNIPKPSFFFWQQTPNTKTGIQQNPN